MANYCSNSIRFFSKDRAKLAVFLRKVSAVCNSRSSGYGDLMVLHGYNARQVAGVIDKRDMLTHCDTKLTVDGDTYSFRVDTETAWSPHMDAFRKMLREKYGNAIHMVYQSEEPGTGVFINTDTAGKYFPERFIIDCCHNGEYSKEYFCTLEEAVEWIEGAIGDFGYSLFDTAETVERKVQDILPDDGFSFFSFHEYSMEDGCSEERSVA